MSISISASSILGSTVGDRGGRLTAALHSPMGERLKGVRRSPHVADGFERSLFEVTWAVSLVPCFSLLTLGFPPFLFDFLSGWLEESAGSPPCLWPLTSARLGWSWSAGHPSGLLGFEAGAFAPFPCSVRPGVCGRWLRGTAGVLRPSDFSLVTFSISGPTVSSGVEAWRRGGSEEWPGSTGE